MCVECGCETRTAGRTETLEPASPAAAAGNGSGAARAGQFHRTGRPAPDEGEITTVEVDGLTVAVARAEGTLYAFADACTHLQCSLSGGDLEGRTVVCPCHLGTFDLATGAVLDGPPPTPVRTWPVREADGVVEIGQ